MKRKIFIILVLISLPIIFYGAKIGYETLTKKKVLKSKDEGIIRNKAYPSGLIEKVFFNTDAKGEAHLKIIKTVKKIVIYNLEDEIETQIIIPRRKQVVFSKYGDYFGFVGYEDYEDGTGISDFKFYNQKGELLWQTDNIGGGYVAISPEGKRIMALKETGESQGTIFLYNNKGRLLYKKDNADTILFENIRARAVFTNNYIGVLIKRGDTFFLNSKYEYYLLNYNGEIEFRKEFKIEYLGAIGISPNKTETILSLKLKNSPDFYLIKLDKKGNIIFNNKLFVNNFPQGQMFFTKDNRKVIVSEDALYMIDIETGNILWKTPIYVGTFNIYFTKNEKYIIKHAHRNVLVFEADTGKLIEKIDGYFPAIYIYGNKIYLLKQEVKNGQKETYLEKMYLNKLFKKIDIAGE